jgi:Cu+-exporting ATPase
MGVLALVDGRKVLVGNERLMLENGVTVDGMNAAAQELASNGKTPMYVAFDGQAAGLVVVADTVKTESKEAVQELQALGLEVWMLTGDNEATADAIAAQLGIRNVMANVLPGQKAAKVEELQAAGKRVAMVGDGVNDAPALARADLGIAIGTGADVAMEASDVTLVGGDVRGVVTAIALSRRTISTIRQNLFWAFFYNVILIPVAAGVLFPIWGLLLNPVMAAAAMAMSSVSVVSNSLRLRSFAPPKNAQEILHPPLRQRITDISYLVAIGLFALAVGVASLFVFKPGVGSANMGMDTSQMAREAALDLPQGNQPVDVRLVLGQAAAPGSPVTLAFDLTDKATGKAVDNLQAAHEAPMHLVIVSYDMTYFAHLHPEAKGAGRYTATNVFPTAGDYVLYVEFAPEGMADEVHRFDLPVGTTGSAPAQMAADMSTHTVDGLDASIKLVGAETVQAGKEAVFTVNLELAGQPVTDLQAYLGAAAHVVILNERAGGFAHVHAVAGSAAQVGGGMDEMSAPPAQFGPDVSFAHTFPASGLYKMWVQVARGDSVVTIPWVVEVKRGLE